MLYETDYNNICVITIYNICTKFFIKISENKTAFFKFIM